MLAKLSIEWTDWAVINPDLKKKKSQWLWCFPIVPTKGWALNHLWLFILAWFMLEGHLSQSYDDEKIYTRFLPSQAKYSNSVYQVPWSEPSASETILLLQWSLVAYWSSVPCLVCLPIAMVWMFMFPQNSYVDILTPNVMVCGLWKVIRSLMPL